MTKKIKHEKKKILLVSAAVILLAAVIFGVFFADNILALISPRAKVVEGSLDTVEYSDSLNEIPHGEIRFRINTAVTLERWYLKGNIMLEVPQICPYTLQFSFFNVENGKEIYTSPKIAPGYCLNEDRLVKEVEAGKYECTYVVSAYSASGKFMGEYGGFLSVDVSR